MTVDTQAERARRRRRGDRELRRASRTIVGSHWFQYYDHPKGGRADGEDYDFGLVDINDQPYRRLTAALAAANREAPTIHAAAASRREPRPNAVITVPHAAVAVADRSLADWPKPASLLPPLVAVAGRGRFRRGLSVVERAGPRAGDDRPGLFRHRPARL